MRSSEGALAPGGRVITWTLAVLAAAGVLACATLALFGEADFLCLAMKDDGFYYLALARNIAEGHGATFDGIARTNGFHPLWTVALTPIFWMTRELMTPVRLTMLLALAIQLAGAWAVARAARRVTGESASRIAGLYYLCNPIGLYLVVSGMESALVGLLVALLAGESIRIRQGEDVLARPGGVVRLGLLCGLAVLARTDAILLSGLVLAGAIVVPSIGGERRPARSRVRGAMAAGGVMVLLLVPWIVWNIAHFGTIVPVSARAHRLHALADRPADGPVGIAETMRAGLTLAQGLLNQLAARAALPRPVIVLLLAAGVAVLAAWIVGLIRDRRTRPDIARMAVSLDAPILYAIGTVFAAFVVLGHIRSWYVAGPLVVGALLVALPAHFGWGTQRVSRPTRILSRVILIAVVIAQAPLAASYTLGIVLSARRTFTWRQAADWVAERTEPDDRVASFNSGSFGYLAPRVVVNLDGVVNNPGTRALEEHRLIEFLRDWKIRYVLDDPDYVARYMRVFAGGDWKQVLVPVDTLRAPVVVYEVRAP